MNIADTDSDAQEFSDRIEAFFSGGTPGRPQGDLTIGISDDERQRNASAELERLLDTLDDGADLAKAVEEPDNSEPTYERIDEAPALTPYDRARERLSEAEVWCEVSEPDTEDYHRAMAERAAASHAVKKEIERSTDDSWRDRRAIDVYRAGEGREEYNTSRRKVRSQPNTRTKDMTPEQREQHKLDMNAKRVWVSKKRKLGWSEDRIEAELPNWWERRAAKSASA